MNHIKYFTSLIIVLMFSLMQIVALNPFNKKVDKADALSPEKKISELFFKKEDAYGLSDEINRDKLPVANTTVYPVDKPEGVVVYIPQTHQNPGTNVADPANDSAQVAQQEIYQIVDHLGKEAKIKFLMMEGEKYGPAPSGEMATVSRKIDIRNQLIALSGQLKNELAKESVPQEDAAALLADVDDGIKYLDREIDLKGAPYMAKAANADLTVYGSENPDTYEKSADIVRNYIYEKDRLAALDGSGGGNIAQSTPQSSIGEMIARLRARISGQTDSKGEIGGFAGGQADLEAIRKMLDGLKLNNALDVSSLTSLIGSQDGDPLQSASFQSSLMKIEQIGTETNDGNIGKLVQGIRENCSALDEIRNQKIVSAVQTADRSANPYNGISDEGKLKQAMALTEKELQAVVVDQRNKETAENFKKALAETNQQVGILQFGAGHEEGLVKELNKQNLSVIVVTPDEVQNTVQN